MGSPGSPESNEFKAISSELTESKVHSSKPRGSIELGGVYSEPSGSNAPTSGPSGSRVHVSGPTGSRVQFSEPTGSWG
eukprot:1379242-Amorphochlora_amoeboformis.AAC.1